MKTDVQAHRVELTKARRIVVKIGSRVLVQSSGRPDLRRMRELVRQLAALSAQGREVVVVTSGAVGAGMEALRMKRRPRDVRDLQMAAAVGQSRLMAVYDGLFAAKGIRIGQILLTHDDLRHRLRHLNARNTMLNLLEHKIVPIVNENDVVAVDEIKFGDNDLLAALVSILVEADALLLLTTVDGLREPAARGTRRVSFLEGVSDKTLSLAKGKGSELSTGGMASKLTSASMALSAGTRVVIANGRTDGVITDVFSGKDCGTHIAPADRRPTHRERWIAYFHKPGGTLVVDDGARDAILKKGRSLLPIGICNVEGDFESGSVVDVCDKSGNVIARGLSDYGAADVKKIMGKRTSEIAAILGSCDYEDVVHRDNLVVLDTAGDATGVLE